MQQTFHCYRCGAQNHIGQPYCWNCQSPFQWNCPNCKAPVQNTMHTCPYCGVLLNWPQPQRNTQQAYQQGYNHQKENSAYTPYESYVNTVAPDIFKILSPLVKNALSKLPEDKQELFVDEFKRRYKKNSVAYLLWFFFGWHYIYLKTIGWQLAFWLSFGGFLIWWFVDVFRIPGMVRSCNEDIARQIMRDLKIIYI